MDGTLTVLKTYIQHTTSIAENTSVYDLKTTKYDQTCSWLRKLLENCVL